MTAFLPLDGAFLIIRVAILVVIVFGLVDSLLHRDASYRAAGKLTKPQWVAILSVALVFGLLSVFSVLDVRPAIRSVGGGGSSSSGPYGPW
jgi:hypothetical protein